MYLTAEMARELLARPRESSPRTLSGELREERRRVRHRANIVEELEWASMETKKREVIYYLGKEDVEWMVEQFKQNGFEVRVQPDFVYKLFISF